MCFVFYMKNMIFFLNCVTISNIFEDKINSFKLNVLNLKKHKIFQKKSAVNVFSAKKASKFRDWLDCSTLELKPNSLAMEILSYLAYETVAQVCRNCFVIFHDEFITLQRHD